MRLPDTFTHLIFSLIMLLISVHSQANNSSDSLTLNEHFKTITPTSQLVYFEEPERKSNEFNLDYLKAQHWKAVPNSAANFGFSDSIFWFQLSLKNIGAFEHELYLHLDYALLDNINVYQVSANQLVQKFESGDHLPFSERPVKYPTFLFPITIAPDTDADIFIRIETQGTVQAPISLWNKEHFLLNSQQFLFLYGCFLSAMLIMSAYNFCLFLTIRDKNYLLYSVFILLATGVHSSLDGFAYQWFWPNLPNWHQVSAVFFIATGCFVTVLFTKNILSVPKKGATHIGTTFLLILTACSAMMSLVLSYRHAAMLNAFTTIISMIGVMLICLTTLKYRPGIARYFVLAWTTYFGGIVLKSTSNIGLIDSTFLSEYAGNIGAVSAILIMSLALAERIKEEKRDKENAQLESIKYLSRFQSLYENALEGVYTFTINGRLLSANPAFLKLMGVASVEEFNNAIPSETSFSLNEERIQRLVKVLREFERVDDHETQLSNQLGTTNWINLSARLVIDPTTHDELIEGTMININERKAIEEKLKHLANHDSLTGLVNRRAFEAEISSTLSAVQEHQLNACLLYLDLDQFKIVNDLCGHSAGDLLLKNLSQRLYRKIDSFNKRHVIARLGGDEFGILLSDVPLSKSKDIAEQIRLIIEEFLFVWESNRFSLGVSIGLVEMLPFHQTTEQLLVMADTACYLAKDQGRNRVHIFVESDQELQIRQLEMQWVSNIKQALSEDNFFLVFQEIAANQVKDEQYHYEILLRLINENGNLCAPGQFLAIAERYNLMPSIDRWVIRHFFKWLSEQPDHLEKLSCASINLSPQSLSDDSFSEFLISTFDLYAIPHHKICFEITESMAITHIDNTHTFIETLHRLGCRFALDDFGTGFSSYAYLKELKVDYLKIDGMFIKNLTQDDVSLAMVKSISDVAKAIGIETIAEFVESQAIREKLIELGITYSQGYHIHKPVKLDINSFAKLSDESIHTQDKPQLL